MGFHWLLGDTSKYFDNFHFDKARDPKLTKLDLNVRRTYMLLPMAMMFVTSFATNKFSWFFYYFTFWGFLLTMVHIAASIKASNYPQWQLLACVTGELAAGMNVVITVLYWLVLFPLLLPEIKGWFLWLHLTTLHSVPILFQVYNLWLTDMTLIRHDWLLVFCGGLVYIFANYLGFIETGQPIYFIADWSNPEFTFCCYLLIAVLDALAFKWMAKLSRKWGQRD